MLFQPLDRDSDVFNRTFHLLSVVLAFTLAGFLVVYLIITDPSIAGSTAEKEFLRPQKLFQEDFDQDYKGNLIYVKKSRREQRTVS